MEGEAGRKSGAAGDGLRALRSSEGPAAHWTAGGETVMSVVRLRSWEGNNLHTAAHRGAHRKRARRTYIPVATALLLAATSLGVVGAVPAQEADASGAAAELDLTPLPGAAETAAVTVVPAVVSTGDFVRMVVVLAAVLGAIYLLFRLIRRSSRASVGNAHGITLLGSRSLGGSRNLHLVQVGGDVYLIGATDQALNLIAQITDQDSIDALTPNHAQQRVAGRRFADLLADIGPAPGAAPGATAATAAAADFLHRQQERLQRLRRQRQPGEVGAAD